MSIELAWKFQGCFRERKHDLIGMCVKYHHVRSFVLLEVGLGLQTTFFPSSRIQMHFFLLDSHYDDLYQII